MSAEILGRGEPTANQLRVLDRITRAASRANRLIADLLDFTQARLGTGLAVDPKSIDPHAAVGEAIEELAMAFPGRELRRARHGEAIGRADADRVAQLVVNLVSNAMAYGDPSLPITVTSTASAGSFSVAVHNFGAPIPEDARDVLFEPMVRGEGHGSGGRSVGLGLYIVSEIAKAHGGSVTLESNAMVGTTFTARFPG